MNTSDSWTEGQTVFRGLALVLGRKTPLKSISDILLTRNDFKTFKMEVEIINPIQCGLVFDFQSQKNFKIFYYNNKKNMLILSEFKDGKQSILQKQKLSISNIWPLRVIRKDQALEIYYESSRIMLQSLELSHGRVGLLSLAGMKNGEMFRRVSIAGKTYSGKNISHQHVSKISVKNMIDLILLYGIFIGIFFNVRKCRGDYIKGEKESIPLIIFQLLIGFYIFHHIFAQAEIHYANYYKGRSAESLLMTIVFFVILYAVSFLYGQRFKQVQQSTFILSFYLSFYLLQVFNQLTFHINDRLIIYATMLLLFLPVLIFKKYPIIEKVENSRKTFYLANILIFLWFVHSWMYFSAYNLDANRTFIIDEIHLWGTAASNMLSQGVEQAHQIRYSGGGLHSLCVSFLSVLPAKFFHVMSSKVIFTFPAVILLLMCQLMRESRKNAGMLTVFIAALFFVINDTHWIKELVYGLIYSEGFYMMAFCVLIHQLITFSQTTDYEPKALLAFAFTAGLFSFIKSYASIFGGVFLIVLFLVYQNRKWDARIILVSLMVFLLPIILWTTYTMNNAYFELGTKLSSKTLIFQAENFQNMLKQISGWFNGPKWICFFSLFTALFLKGRQKWLLLPIVSYLLGFIIYYGFIYGGSDFISSARYLAVPLMALLYLGSYSIQAIYINKTANGRKS